MKALIEAFQIFLKYSDDEYPTHCEHDVLYVVAVQYDTVTDEDKERLKELGFIEDTENGGFKSFRFGSC